MVFVLASNRILKEGGYLVPTPVAAAYDVCDLRSVSKARNCFRTLTTEDLCDEDCGRQPAPKPLDRLKTSA